MEIGKGVSGKQPEFLAMTTIIFSEAGQAAAVSAAKAGQPALCGVDTLLRTACVGYANGNHQSLRDAGFIVARLMRDELNYVEGAHGVKCPPGSRAATAIKWIPPI